MSIYKCIKNIGIFKKGYYYDIPFYGVNFRYVSSEELAMNSKDNKSMTVGDVKELLSLRCMDTGGVIRYDDYKVERYKESKSPLNEFFRDNFVSSDREFKIKKYLDESN